MKIIGLGTLLILTTDLHKDANNWPTCLTTVSSFMVTMTYACIRHATNRFDVTQTPSLIYVYFIELLNFECLPSELADPSGRSV